MTATRLHLSLLVHLLFGERHSLLIGASWLEPLGPAGVCGWSLLVGALVGAWEPLKPHLERWSLEPWSLGVLGWLSFRCFRVLTSESHSAAHQDIPCAHPCLLSAGFLVQFAQLVQLEDDIALSPAMPQSQHASSKLDSPSREGQRPEERLRVAMPDTLARLQEEHKCADVKFAFIANEGMDLAICLTAVLSPKERGQHKFTFRSATGQSLCFRCDVESGLFYRRTGDGVLMIAVDYDLMERLEEESEMLPDPEAWSLDAWRVELDATLTGNHRPRRHKVRVPTRAGEPVRG